MAEKAKKPKLMKVECEPDCGFMIRSHDQKEVIEAAKQHALKSHKMKVTEKEVKEWIKSA